MYWLYLSSPFRVSGAKQTLHMETMQEKYRGKKYVVCKPSTTSTLSLYHIFEIIPITYNSIRAIRSVRAILFTEVFLMNTKQKLHQLHLNEWASRFAEQKASGLTVRQWCEQNHYTIHTYNYWKHLLKEELESQVLPDIVPLAILESSSFLQSGIPVSSVGTPNPNRSNYTIRQTRITATLTINGVSIEVPSDISEEFLRTIIKAVRYA